MSSLAPVESLLILDPSSIPDVDFSNYSTSELRVGYEFYENPAVDTYEGQTISSDPLLNHWKLDTKLIQA